MGWVPTLVIQSTSEIIFSSPTIPAIANLVRHIENYTDWHRGHIDCQSAKITTNQALVVCIHQPCRRVAGTQGVKFLPQVNAFSWVGKINIVYSGVIRRLNCLVCSFVESTPMGVAAVAANKAHS